MTEVEPEVMPEAEPEVMPEVVPEWCLTPPCIFSSLADRMSDEEADWMSDEDGASDRMPGADGFVEAADGNGTGGGQMRASTPYSTRSSSVIPDEVMGHPRPLHQPPAPLLSGLSQDAPENVTLALTQLAASLVRERLIHAPGKLAIIAPSGNAPLCEALFNTKISIQFCIADQAALEGSQSSPRLCTGCCAENTPVSMRGSPCICGDVNGCLSCIGRSFICPSCNRTFSRRTMYESGSGRATIGRDPNEFEIRMAPEGIQRGAAFLSLTSAQAINSAVWVMYEGADLSPVGEPRNLGYHRDFGDAANSQAVGTQNRTISVGHTRHLSLVQMAYHPCTNRHHPVAGEPPTEIKLTAGSIFSLCAPDEESCARQFVDGRILQAAWYHGVRTPVAPKEISCGFVYRTVVNCCDVDDSSNVVILSPEKLAQYQSSYPQYNHAPVIRAPKLTKAEHYQAARQEWLDMPTKWDGSDIEACLAGWSHMPKVRATTAQMISHLVLMVPSDL